MSFLSSVARADLEWRGMLVEKDTPRFALVDTASGDSKWVQVGGAFLAYSVENYDADKQVLTLNRDGTRIELKLNAAAATPPPEPPTDDTAGLYGMPLAEALANRGDEQLKALLDQHRGAVLHRDDLVRRINAAQMAPADANSANEEKRQAAIAAMKAEAQKTDSEVAQLVDDITKLADQRRKRPNSSSGK
ncbi:MAG TPA: hypothetical protein VFT72_12790 [Opitutaceae bacterium]|nr:hypothetical protein [Opitutaceae bacterium]